jgi:hypothetical protein
MAKGKFKRNRSSPFQKGHILFYRRGRFQKRKDNGAKSVRRLTEPEFNSTVRTDDKGVIACYTEKGKVIQSKVLRPAPAPPSYWTIYNEQKSEGNNDTYAFVHRGRDAYMWVTEVRSHDRANPSCEGYLNWYEDKCEQRANVWAVVLKCPCCRYVSEKYKLYREVYSNKRGRRYADANLGVQVGLAKQGIGPSGLREIMCSMGATPPSLKSLQKGANQVNPKIVSANQKDMKQRMANLRTLNVKRGLPHDAPINIEADATYNNRLNSGVGKTPYQPATQASYLVAENVTSERQIICANTYSKICSCRKRNILGVIQHGTGCPANLPHDAVIGNEGRYMKDAVGQINDQGLAVEHVTLDGDSNANAAARDILQPNDPGREVKVLRCSRHLTATLKSDLKNSRFSDTMFPGQTKDERSKAQARFAQDFGGRCTAEFKAITDKHKGDVPTIKNKCSYVIDAMISCYQGNCEQCKQHSFICSGNEKTWRRPYLRSSHKYGELEAFINPDEDDRHRLRQCLSRRLGPAAVEGTFLNSDQNKCEAANRGLSKGLPKHITWRRNFPGKAHACIHSMNNKPGTSIAQLCEVVGAAISPGSNVTRALEGMDKSWNKNSQRKKSSQYKMARARSRDQKYKSYDDKLAISCYSHGQADKSQVDDQVDKDCYNQRQRRQRAQTSTTLLDHSYLVAGTSGTEHNYFKKDQ